MADGIGMIPVSMESPIERADCESRGRRKAGVRMTATTKAVERANKVAALEAQKYRQYPGQSEMGGMELRKRMRLAGVSFFAASAYLLRVKVGQSILTARAIYERIA